MNHLLIGAALAALGLCACTQYTPILDGPANENYKSDLTACQTLAASQEKFTQEVLGATIAGGLLGATTADHDGNATAGEGLIGGALFAYTMARFDAADRKEEIVITCMQGRGHAVVG